MKLLDQYIIKRLLSTFVFVVLILLAVITVIDLTDKMDKYAKAQLTTMEIMGYYADFIPWIGGLLTPITIFIATVYVCARMAGHTEVIAILSSGVSFRRMLMPYFMGAFAVALASFFLNGWIIPNSNKSRLAFELEYLKNKTSSNNRNIHFQIAPNTILYIEHYNTENRSGSDFTIERFADNRLMEKFSADRIMWDTTKQKWTLYNWKLKKVDQIFDRTKYATPSAVDSTQIMKIDSIKTDSIQQVAATLSADTLKRGDIMDTTLIIHPKEFESDYRKYDGLTMSELSAYIKTLRARGSTGVEVYEVEKYTRYASPFTIFILVFMGVIVSSRKSRGGTGLQIALGFALSFVFIIFFMLFRTFAENGSMPAEISVWVPNIVFGGIALIMYKYVPR